MKVQDETATLSDKDLSSMAGDTISVPVIGSLLMLMLTMAGQVTPVVGLRVASSTSPVLFGSSSIR